MDSKFKIGDKVMPQGEYAERGSGTVVAFQPDSVQHGVAHDSWNEGHSLDDKLPDCSGWWYFDDELELIPSYSSKPTLDHFEVGKYYRWIGPTPPSDWGISEGASRAWETRKIFKCITCDNDGSAKFASFVDSMKWGYRGYMNNFEEVLSPSQGYRDSSILGKAFSDFAKTMPYHLSGIIGSITTPSSFESRASIRKHLIG